MNRKSNASGQRSSVPVQVTWWAAAALGVCFAAVENGHIIVLGWTAACIALPFLWNAQGQALRVGARILMAGFALLSLIAMVSIAADGTWDVSDSLAFTVAALTVLASGTTFVRIWRGDTGHTAPALAAADSDAAAQSGSRGAPPGGRERTSEKQISPKIFISYRRDDSQATTDRLFEHLASEFPRENLFRDIDSIPKGQDFRRWIERSVTSCDVLLAIIGTQWLGVLDEDGRRRLDNPADFVRLEIETALKCDLPVIPVLLSKAQMPKPEDLPESMRELAFRHGTLVRHDPDFASDVRRLVADLRTACAQPRV
jgi:TIR domain-containing protein